MLKRGASEVDLAYDVIITASYPRHYPHHNNDDNLEGENSSSQ